MVQRKSGEKRYAAKQKNVRGRPEPTAHDVAFKRIDGAGRYFGSVTR
jgi:hypothetical protein